MSRVLQSHFFVQVLFHHMFLELVNDVAAQISANGEYAVEFASDGVFMLAFVRFWREDELCRVFLKRTGRLHGQTDAEICLNAYIRAAISTPPRLISCTGCSVRTIQLMDLSPYSSFSVQSPPRFEEPSLPQLMHRKSQSVFGRVDFFSTLRYLVVSLEAAWNWAGSYFRQSCQRYVVPYSTHFRNLLAL